MGIDVVQLDADLPLPSYGRPGDAGMDLRSRIDVVVRPGQRVLVPTGLAIALPEGFVALVHPRSGLAFKRGLTVVNAPGTVDAGFRGEIQVALVNLDPNKPVSISRGDRVAQLVIQRFAHAVWNPVSALPESVRGEDGFGSTGVGAS